MEPVQARLSERDRENLEAVAAELTKATGVSVTMTDAFGYLLRCHPGDAAVVSNDGDAGPLVIQLRMILDAEQAQAVDRIAHRLAERKAQLIGGEVEPNRSDAVRFVIRSTTATLQGHK